MANLLVIDDDRAIRFLFEAAFAATEGISLRCAATAEEGLTIFDQWRPDVMLLDIHLPEMHGFEFFRKSYAIDPRVPVIFITSDGTSDVVIQAMRLGAFDYLKKPLHIDQLRQMVASALKAASASREPVALSVGSPETADYFIGSSPVMLSVFKAIGRVANQRIPVLIRGESGTGKELVARALVDNGNRADKPFVSINCAAIPEALLESELFGHERGAFTGADKRRIGRFEQCDGGTIFLDEVGDMSPLIQGKVLRLLQEQTFERVGSNEQIQTDVRIIAATHRPLEDMVKNGEFRQDLLYRLNSYTIQLPPLRERRDDIPALLEYFLRRAKADMGRTQLAGISKEALDLLLAYDWPGNIRELQSVVRQSLLNTTGPVVLRESLPESLQAAATTADRNSPLNDSNVRDSSGDGVAAESLPSATAQTEFTATDLPSDTDKQEKRSEQPSAGSIFFDLDRFIGERIASGSNSVYNDVITEVERRLITQVLVHTEGNQSKAADMLGVTRGKVRDRVAAFGIKMNHSIRLEDAGNANDEDAAEGP